MLQVYSFFVKRTEVLNILDKRRAVSQAPWHSGHIIYCKFHGRIKDFGLLLRGSNVKAKFKNLMIQPCQQLQVFRGLLKHFTLNLQIGKFCFKMFPTLIVCFYHFSLKTFLIQRL